MARGALARRSVMGVRGRWRSLSAPLALAWLAGCAATRKREEFVTIEPQVLTTRFVTSNITRADYAGSQACQRCHTKIFARWSGSPMRNMTRLESSHRAPAAPFDGRSFRFKDDSVELFTTAGVRYMRIRSRYTKHPLWRVTRTIGGHYREDFTGVPVDGTGPAQRMLGDPTSDRVLPVSWLLFAHELRYKGYSVMVRERPGLKPGTIWKKSCIFCHNTPPLLTTLYDELYGPGAPGYQGAVADRLLPAARRFTWRITDEEGLRRVLIAELELLWRRRFLRFGERKVHDLLGLAAISTQRQFGQKELVEVGIGCEACHLGSAQHVADPQTRTSFEPRSPLLAAVPPGGKVPTTRAPWVNRVCLRCHTVLFSRYPFTWEGKRRRSAAPGGSNVNSGEARDLQLGGCSGELACSDCHDPHQKDDPRHHARLGTVAGNALCIRCHPRYAGSKALAAHTHHRVEGAGSACLACHMPKKNMGLKYELSRYHRIASPTEPVKVLHDRPLECALCHADFSVEKTVATMERWWNKRYDRAALRALYGAELSANTLRRTLERGKAHEQAVAIVVLSENKDRAALAAILRQLGHAYPLLRYFARAAIERLSGRKLAIDMSLPAAALYQAGRQALGLPPSPL